MIRQLPGMYSLEGYNCHILQTYYPNSNLICLSAISAGELVTTLTTDIKEFRDQVPQGYILVRDVRIQKKLETLGIVDNPITTFFAGVRHVPCSRLRI